MPVAWLLVIAASQQDAAIERQIDKLLSSSPPERIAAANGLSKLDSTVVPKVLPQNWPCAKKIRDANYQAPAGCERFNEAVYHAINILATIAQRERKNCGDVAECPAKAALFDLSYAQGGIGFDDIPLLDSEQANLSEDALREHARRAMITALHVWSEPPAGSKPARVAGTTKVFVDTNSTAPGFYMACRHRVYVTRPDQPPVSAVLGPDTPPSIGCKLTRVRVADDSTAPGVIFLEFSWPAMGGANFGTTLVAYDVRKEARARCSIQLLTEEEHPSDVLPMRTELDIDSSGSCRLKNPGRAEALEFRSYQP